jgi:2',3'-cyclic-nucleotide 2'-phosphodiesterase (5'-nucleotidase family)
LARRATLIDSLRALGEPLLVVDAGDFMHRDRERNLPDSRATWKEFQRARYDAVAFGREEFDKWDLAQEWMREFPIPVVCTNVEQLVGGRWVPIGEKYRLVTVNGVKVGIVSLISENQLLPNIIARYNDTLRLLPPLETVQGAVDELRAKRGAEIVVVLAMVDNDAVEQYATLLHGVDAIVGGYQPPNRNSAELIGDVVVDRVGSRGQYMGSTELIVSPQGKRVEFGGLNVTLGAGISEQPEVLAEVKNAKNESTLLMRDAGRREREAIEAKAGETNPDVSPDAAAKAAADQAQPGTDKVPPSAQPVTPPTPPGQAPGKE